MENNLFVQWAVSSWNHQFKLRTNSIKILRANLRNGKLAWERNSKITPMGGNISTGDLLRTLKLKNTDATSNLNVN